MTILLSGTCTRKVINTKEDGVHKEGELFSNSRLPLCPISPDVVLFSGIDEPWSRPLFRSSYFLGVQETKGVLVQDEQISLRLFFVPSFLID